MRRALTAVCVTLAGLAAGVLVFGLFRILSDALDPFRHSADLDVMNDNYTSRPTTIGFPVPT